MPRLSEHPRMSGYIEGVGTIDESVPLMSRHLWLNCTIKLRVPFFILEGFCGSE